MGAHALLSPSGASRWIACPPSARLEEKYARTSSEAADEGTLAHLLVETLLLRGKGTITGAEFDKAMEEIKANDLYDAAMMEHADQFATYVMERFSEAQERTPDARLYLEETLDLSYYVPESFGTVDVDIVADKVLEIIDFKYGKGVPVYAEKNSQMMLYALGSLILFDLLYEINEVRLTIYQPRLDSITTYTITVEELKAWAEEVLRPAALLAWNGEGEFKAGSHCRFCKIRGTCRANADYNMEMAKHDFKDVDLLSNNEIAEILKRSDEFTKWLTAVEAHALSVAVNKGEHFPGFKLVAGRSVRKITNEPAVTQILLDKGYNNNQVFKPRALVGITELEKLTGKEMFKEWVGPFVVKPPGTPTLVPYTDKRPEYNSAANAADDFKDL